MNWPARPRPATMAAIEDNPHSAMSSTISSRVAALGHTLPPALPPVANFVSTVRSGAMLFVSGQIATNGGAALHPGRLGGGVTLEQGRDAAAGAALALLAHLAGAPGDPLAAVRQVVRLGVYVASTPDFTQHPQVANGASDLMVAVFGEAGRHARAAVGVAALPLGASVEVEAVFQLEAAQ